MNKVIAIIGSPRKNGETYKNVQKFEQQLKKLDKNVNFNYIFLKDARIEPCKGCGACLVTGEEHCPIKDDDKEKILNMIMESDGVIIGVLVYSLQVPALTKNLLANGKYNVFINTTNLSTGYYELTAARYNYEKKDIKGFYLLNASVK